MAKSENQKLKLLYLRDFLRQASDPQHPVSVEAIISHLAKKGIRAERKCIYDDLHALESYGMEIHYRRGSNGGYYVSQRDFELSELKLLVDAVLSSKFLSSTESMTLIRKLAALSGEHTSELLRRELVLAGRVKTENANSFQNIDALHEAIAANRQVRFRYFKWGVDRQKHYRDKSYVVSPYALCWDDENYYLVGWSEDHGLTHYRVDKMEDIHQIDAPRFFPEDSRQFQPAAYSKAVFGMYRGENKRVRLRCENSLAGVIIDRFGHDSMLIPDGADHFTCLVEVAISPNFLGWVTSFRGRAVITFPEDVKEEYRRFCQAALDAIDANN